MSHAHMRAVLFVLATFVAMSAIYGASRVLPGRATAVDRERWLRTGHRSLGTHT